MARRSHRASVKGIQTLREAIRREQRGQTYLASAVHCSRQTIWSLLQGNAIDSDVFVAICDELNLRWEDITTVEIAVSEQAENSSLDESIQQVRAAIKPFIYERCGTMRVLDMNQPIGLNEIYTQVNILEKITGRIRRELADLQDGSPENFERFSLGAVKATIPGLAAVEKHNKLMILGKPGAGKTTFLKHLAIQCIGGAFQSDRVPLFITLKDFAETDGQPDLVTFIDRVITPSAHATHEPPKMLTQQILGQGRALILLDGLDEVRETDASRVLREIQQFSDLYSRNAVIITNRIATREYTFQQFTELEVANFDHAQIDEFAHRWFHNRQEPDKTKQFLRALNHEPYIHELASNPLLLTLLCIVFEDAGEFPSNHADFLRSGIDVLLKQWDSKRNIERDQIYKKLSLKHKEDLLSQIAWCTFEAGNYFFKQKDLERQIRKFIENLPGASTDEETLNLDSEAVLKSIEAQYGLFVERARGIYSFSHLTFHEYLAAREANEQAYIPQLIQHITDVRWREVILLTIGMLPNADELLWQTKKHIDGLLADDNKLQEYLIWLDEKAKSVTVPDLDLDFNLTLAPNVQCKLHELREQLPRRDGENPENFKQQWKTNGEAWTAQIRAVTVQHRNIEHDWQFSDAQREKLQQYYDANKLLVDCLNSDCYVSRAVRQEIEETLLLPIAALENRQQ
ncbi:MAG: signal transduction protein [Leptolyngbya sp.]|nr:MAG: signal transduction protein [Leptolyngbya sp.]